LRALKLSLSGQTPVSITPTMISLPKSEASHAPLQGLRPRNETRGGFEGFMLLR